MICLAQVKEAKMRVDEVEWLSMSGAGERLQLSRQRVDQLIKEGRLEAWKSPAGWRLIPVAEVERLARERAEAKT